MSALRGEKLLLQSLPRHMVWFVLVLIFLTHPAKTFGQATVATQGSANPGAPTSLSDLLNEAERNNPQIEAARQGWNAAKQVPTQVSTLPDPQFEVQHFSVGSPRPFAGYTNSDFANVGFGV